MFWCDLWCVRVMWGWIFGCFASVFTHAFSTINKQKNYDDSPDWTISKEPSYNNNNIILAWIWMISNRKEYLRQKERTAAVETFDFAMLDRLKTIKWYALHTMFTSTPFSFKFCAKCSIISCVDSHSPSLFLTYSSNFIQCYFNLFSFFFEDLNV